jgi:uncharacterized membrane protein
MAKPASGNTRLHYIELFIAALMFISSNEFSFQFSFLFENVFVLGSLISVLFLALALAFVLMRNGRPAEINARWVSALRHAIFIAIFVAYVAMLASAPVLLISLLKRFWLTGVFLVAFLPIFFLVFIAVYFIKSKEPKAYLLLVAALLILVLYYPSKVLIYGFKASDEELIMFKSVSSLLEGVNPYAVSYANVVYENAKTIGFTLTTTKMIMGTMAYPALFFLTFVPFYFISPPTIQNLMGIDLPLQASVFAFALIVALAFMLDKDEMLKPRLSLIVLFVFAITNSASVTVYLMIALLLLAYSMIDSKYSWILLGLCASIQEELWLPVLFLIAYSLNNQGIRKGLVNALGTAAVFLAINSYFIILSPGAFFGNVFDPLNSLIFPNGHSSIGILLVKFFPILLSSFSLLFEVVSLLLVFLLLYWNRKELIPLFSMIPFLVLHHSLNSYYTTFIFVLIFAIGQSKGREKGWIETFLKKRKLIAYGTVAAFLAVIFLVIYSSHTAMKSGFEISTSQPTLVFENLSSTYRTTISYGNLSNRTIYVVAVGADRNANIGLFGILNESIIGSPAVCDPDAFDCMINVNRIRLPENGSSYDLTVRVKWYNATNPIKNVAVEIYNGENFYFGRAAYNDSS